MSAAPQHLHTLAEYLALERASDTRYEFHNAAVFAMSGGTLQHDIITGNAYMAQFVRQPDGKRLHAEVNELGASLYLPSLDCTLWHSATSTRALRLRNGCLYSRNLHVTTLRSTFALYAVAMRGIGSVPLYHRKPEHKESHDARE